MNKREKKALFKKICACLEACQCRKGPKLITDFKKLYYKEKTSQDAAVTYQKCFMDLSWKAFFITIKENKSLAQEKIIKMFTEFAKTAGTLEDCGLFQFPFTNQVPFFISVFQIYNKQHSDERHLVRLHHTQLVYEILKVHGNSTTFTDMKDVKKGLLQALSQRIRDKQPSVRSVAFKCLHFFLKDMNSEFLQKIKHHAEFDPNCEARKSAFMVICTLPSVKASFIINKAYDCEESIRIEAFKALVRVPAGRLKTDQRVSIIQWGLMQPAPKVKKVILEELVPAWVNKGDTCKNSIINLLTLLDVIKSSRTSELILSALYPDDSDETFSQVDLDFLDDNHLPPVTERNLEIMVYWRFLSKRFHNKPFSREKIIPGPGELTQLIYQIIELIHEEHENAIRENRPEEFENILCLAQVLRIAELCDYEEGSRGTMESALRIILRDPVLDEAVIIHVVVDVAHKILGHEQFNEFMMEIIRELFEPQLVEVRKNKSRVLLEKSLNQQNKEVNVNSIHHSTLINSSKCLDRVEPVQGIEIPKKTRLTDDEIQRIKSERGELMLKRHHLLDQKDKAIRDCNFLQAHELNEEINAVKSRAEEMNKIIQDNEKSELCPVRSPELVRRENNSLILSPIIAPNGTHIDEENEDDDDTIQNQSENENTIVPFANRLRAIVMFTRFLTWQTELSSFSRMIYEHEAFPSLEERDYRIRLHVIYIIGMVGLLDPMEAKKALLVMISAVGPNEDVRVRLPAYKVIVDLFLQHDFPVFRFREDEAELMNLPHPLNKFDTEISKADMQQCLLDVLDSFPGETKENEQQNVKHICVQFLGMMKLLIRERITNDSVIAQLLMMWADPSFTGTPLCFHIGHWIPLYCSMGVPFALRVGTAFVKCVKNYNLEPEDVKEGEAPPEFNLEKLAEFVFSNTNSRCLSKFEKGSTVHAQIALQILTEIDRCLNSPNGLIFMKCLKMLEINDEPYVTKIRKKIKHILFESSYVSTKGVRSALVLFEKQLTKRFGPLASTDGTDTSEAEGDNVETDGGMSEDEIVNIDQEDNIENLKEQQKDIRDAIDED